MNQLILIIAILGFVLHLGQRKAIQLQRSGVARWRGIPVFEAAQFFASATYLCGGLLGLYVLNAHPNPWVRATTALLFSILTVFAAIKATKLFNQSEVKKGLRFSRNFFRTAAAVSIISLIQDIGLILTRR